MIEGFKIFKVIKTLKISTKVSQTQKIFSKILANHFILRNINSNLKELRGVAFTQPIATRVHFKRLHFCLPLFPLRLNFCVMRLMLSAIDFYAFRDGFVTLMFRFLISFVDFLLKIFNETFNLSITWRVYPRVAREAEDLIRFWFRYIGTSADDVLRSHYV